MRTKATFDFWSSKTKLLGGCGVELHYGIVLGGGGGRIVTQFPAKPRNRNIPIVLFDTKPTQSHMQPRNSQYRHTHLPYCFRSPGHNSVGVKNPGKHAA